VAARLDDGARGWKGKGLWKGISVRDEDGRGTDGAESGEGEPDAFVNEERLTNIVLPFSGRAFKGGGWCMPSSSPLEEGSKNTRLLARKMNQLLQVEHECALPGHDVRP
jgi:hypothetical protein